MRFPAGHGACDTRTRAKTSKGARALLGSLWLCGWASEVPLMVQSTPGPPQRQMPWSPRCRGRGRCSLTRRARRQRSRTCWSGWCRTVRRALPPQPSTHQCIAAPSASCSIENSADTAKGDTQQCVRSHRHWNRGEQCSGVRSGGRRARHRGCQGKAQMTLCCMHSLPSSTCCFRSPACSAASAHLRI